MTTEIVVRAKTEEEITFEKLCDAIDEHDRLQNKPPIASNEQERKERFLIYMFRCTEIIDWMIGLLGGLETLNRVIGSTVLNGDIDESPPKPNVRKPDGKRNKGVAVVNKRR